MSLINLPPNTWIGTIIYAPFWIIDRLLGTVPLVGPFLGLLLCETLGKRMERGANSVIHRRRKRRRQSTPEAKDRVGPKSQ